MEARQPWADAMDSMEDRIVALYEELQEANERLNIQSTSISTLKRRINTLEDRLRKLERSGSAGSKRKEPDGDSESKEDAKRRRRDAILYRTGPPAVYGPLSNDNMTKTATAR